MKARGTATDRLADVVQVLQIAHKTGLLVVTRDRADNSLEQGTIKFHNGQIVDANLEQLRGAEAFNRLMAWRTCYFVFQPLTANTGPLSTPTTGPLTPVPLPMQNGTGYGHEREPPLAFPNIHSVPIRLREANEVLPYFHNLGLSRAHRQLFLLVDGRRHVQELMRLTGHRPDEINTLLADLERAGLVRQ
ncbi:MAG TPA: DUF4388 domain-containing protein [Ktedonosporobacter sp.]|nr:DUF4388 domain-containing protein [Ktedonosporobacter sp.]